MLLKFLLMFLDNAFADQLCALDSAFVNDNFMMLAQLYLIIFYGIVQRVIFLVSILDIVNDL